MSWLAAAVVTTTLVSGHQQGKAAKEGAKDQSRQMQANANRREKEGEMDAAEVRRKNRILMGDARAIMAGSGGTTTDPTALLQLGGLAGEGKFNELSYLSEAKLDAEAMRTGAGAVERSGRAAARSSYAGAIQTAVSGQAASSLQGRFSEWKSSRAPVGTGGGPITTSQPVWQRGA